MLNWSIKIYFEGQMNFKGSDIEKSAFLIKLHEYQLKYVVCICHQSKKKLHTNLLTVKSLSRITVNIFFRMA